MWFENLIPHPLLPQPLTTSLLNSFLSFYTRFTTRQLSFTATNVLLSTLVDQGFHRREKEREGRERERERERESMYSKFLSLCHQQQPSPHLPTQEFFLAYFFAQVSLPPPLLPSPFVVVVVVFDCNEIS